MKESKGVAGINFLRLWKKIELVRPWMEQVINWYDEALFRPHVDRAFQFERVGEAHRYVRERRNVGKVLLVP
jgi:NADPH:quinone reductase-like Zn-dependent oxidoreductase